MWSNQIVEPRARGKDSPPRSPYFSDASIQDIHSVLIFWSPCIFGALGEITRTRHHAVWSFYALDPTTLFSYNVHLGQHLILCDPFCLVWKGSGNNNKVESKVSWLWNQLAVTAPWTNLRSGREGSDKQWSGLRLRSQTWKRTKTPEACHRHRSYVDNIVLNSEMVAYIRRIAWDH